MDDRKKVMRLEYFNKHIEAAEEPFYFLNFR